MLHTVKLVFVNTKMTLQRRNQFSSSISFSISEALTNNLLHISLIPYEHTDQRDIFELIGTANPISPMFVRSKTQESRLTHNSAHFLRARGRRTRLVYAAYETNTTSAIGRARFASCYFRIFQ